MKQECHTYLKTIKKSKALTTTLSETEPKDDSNNEDDRILNVRKFGFASHTKHTAEAINMDLLHLWQITCNLEFWNKE